MTIGIILHPYEEEKPSGLGHYILELTENLLAVDQKNSYIIFTKNKLQRSPTFKGNNWYIVSLGFGKLWRELGFLFAPKADVYIFATPMLPFLFRLKKTIVVTHDFPYQYIKADTIKQKVFSFLLHYLHKYSVHRADKVIAISKYTKNEVKKLFGVDEEKITVIYNGFRNVCAAPPAALDMQKPYFLSVGAVKERKNTLRIVEAYGEFKKKQQSKHKLIIVGKTGNPYSEKVMRFVEENNLKDDVVFFGHAFDPELSYLYTHAEALVFPSIIESFGFPVLEAASCGTPVITSKYGGVSEVAGDAALLVDPESISEITEALAAISGNTKLREELIAKGYEQTEKFSWEKTAHAFLKVINMRIHAKK